jgi:hypothetical protein
VPWNSTSQALDHPKAVAKVYHNTTGRKKARKHGHNRLDLMRFDAQEHGVQTQRRWDRIRCIKEMHLFRRQLG